MILVGQYDPPFVRRVAVTLHHYHMPFERNTLSVFRHVPKMRKINPLVRVPALILQSGEVLIDSGAIIDHLDEVASPARAMVPPHGDERRKIMQATALAEGATDKAAQLFYERHFHSPRCVSKDWEKRCAGQISAALAQLESQCGAPWWFDMHMSHADVMTGCLIGYLKLRLPDTFPARKYPKLHGLAQHCELHEEFVRSRIGPDETAPASKK